MSSILKIEPTDPRNPEPTLVVLKFDKPKEVEGKYGPQYMYSVQADGEDKVIYATPGMHRRIEELGARQGDALSIIRTGAGKDTRWDIIMEGREGKALVGRDGDPFVEGPDAARKLKAPTFNPREEFQKRQAQYAVAWEMAKEFLTQSGDDADLNAVAFTFYKMAQDCGFDLTEDTPPFN